MYNMSKYCVLTFEWPQTLQAPLGFYEFTFAHSDVTLFAIYC